MWCCPYGMTMDRMRNVFIRMWELHWQCSSELKIWSLLLYKHFLRNGFLLVKRNTRGGFFLSHFLLRLLGKSLIAIRGRALVCALIVGRGSCFGWLSCLCCRLLRFRVVLLVVVSVLLLVIFLGSAFV